MTLNAQRLLDEIAWVEKQDRIAKERGWSEWNQKTYALDPDDHVWAITHGYGEIFLDQGVRGSAREELANALLADGCGTAYCLAGHVTHTDHPEWSTETVADNAEVYAEHALGLTSNEGHALFWGGNTAERMREIAEQIIAAHAGES